MTYPVSLSKCSNKLLKDPNYRSSIALADSSRVSMEGGYTFHIYTGVITRAKGVLSFSLLASLIHTKSHAPGQYAYSVRATTDVRMSCQYWDSYATTATLHMQDYGLASVFQCPVSRIFNDGNLGELKSIQINLQWRNVKKQVHLPLVQVPVRAKLPLVSCTVPLYGQINSRALREWVIYNLNSIGKMILYVREKSITAVKLALGRFIDRDEVEIVSIPFVTPADVPSSANTESYDANDMLLHNQYFDQVLWLNHCHLRYGSTAKYMVNLDIDEVLHGQHLGFLADVSHRVVDWSLHTIAYSNATNCHFKGASFTEYYRHSQSHPIRKGWPRRKHIFQPDLLNFNWIHGVFSKADSCRSGRTLDVEVAFVKHYADLYIDTTVHGGQCRCDKISPDLPCDVLNAATPPLFTVRPTQSPLYITYTENDGLSNQILALSHMCMYARHVNATLVLPRAFTNHRESENPFTRVEVCALLDCATLEKCCRITDQYDFEMSQSTSEREIRVHDVNTFDFGFDRSSVDLIHFANKQAYQMGLQPNTYYFAQVFNRYPNPIRIHPKYLKYVNAFYGEHPNFMAVQIRAFSKHDYWYDLSPGASPGASPSEQYPSLAAIFEKLPKQQEVFILSTACHETKVARILKTLDRTYICSSELALQDDLHPYENLVISQMISAIATSFFGIEMSTISQVVLRLRDTLRDWIDLSNYNYEIESGAKCNAIWCSAK